jgi:hypothetical protein
MYPAANIIKTVMGQEKSNAPEVKAPIYQKCPMRKLKSPALK